jgi:hypothetical protein
VLFFTFIPFQEATMRRYAVLVVCILLLSASHASAEFYRWVDREGKENFTNDPAKIPPEYRNSSLPVKTDDSRVSVGDKPAVALKTPVSVKEHKDKYGRGEEYWHKKASNLRLKLRDLQDEYDLVLKQLEDQDQKPKKLSSKKKTSHSSLEKKKMKLGKDIAKMRKTLEVDLPEEARRADAYPGWIRE